VLILGVQTKSFLADGSIEIGCRAQFEEIGWTPIHLRRWLRVKQWIRVAA
jgi:hypothetical protein